MAALLSNQQLSAQGKTGSLLPLPQLPKHHIRRPLNPFLSPFAPPAAGAVACWHQAPAEPMLTLQFNAVTRAPAWQACPGGFSIHFPHTFCPQVDLFDGEGSLEGGTVLVGCRCCRCAAPAAAAAACSHLSLSLALSAPAYRCHEPRCCSHPSACGSRGARGAAAAHLVIGRQLSSQGCHAATPAGRSAVGSSATGAAVGSTTAATAAATGRYTSACGASARTAWRAPGAGSWAGTPC